VPTAIHKRALRRAIDLTGSPEALAAQLKVPPTAVRFWLGASSPLPDDVFLKVDLLVDKSLAELRTLPGEKPPGRSPERGQTDS
jgi:hypothetical protein